MVVTKLLIVPHQHSQGNLKRFHGRQTVSITSVRSLAESVITEIIVFNSLNRQSFAEPGKLTTGPGYVITVVGSRTAYSVVAYASSSAVERSQQILSIAIILPDFSA